MNLDKVLSENSEMILVIDDESVTRMMVRQVLEESGYRVDEAEDGLTGIEKAKRLMPDLILLDVRMPGMNGFSACRAIRELPAGKHVPILILTGLDDVVSVQLAFDAGATDFITKPINWALLVQRLHYALRAKEREDRLRESEARLAHAQRVARLGQWHLDLTDNTLTISNGLAGHLGFPKAEILVQDLRKGIHRQDRRAVYRVLRQVLEAGKPAEVEFRLIKPDGKVCVLHINVESSGERHPQRLQGTAQDVTARIEAEARISYYAHYDSLTDLPNRVLFWDRLTHSIKDSRQKGERFAVLMLDFDRFAALNMSVGHAKGDRVICRVAELIAQCLRDGDTLSRVGGDEFAIIFRGFDRTSELDRLVACIIAIFDHPIRLDEFEAHLSASVGVALYPNDGDDLDSLLMHADVAQSRAKVIAGPSYQFYTSTMGDSARERMELEAALRSALREEAFELHYQPLVSPADGGVWGVEALLRWNHPQLGLIFPNDFIPILEETGQLNDVGEWIFRRACEDMKSEDFVVSINISPIQFRDQGLLQRIQRALGDTGFPPNRLQIEITENVLIQDQQPARAMLDALREQKVSVAIDDFGTGFSSLSYLRSYNADFLKIDRSFINDIETERSNEAIVRSAINLGHDLGMRIVGEGVEDASALKSLEQMGCDLVQGFLIAHPLGLSAFKEWLAAR